METQTELRAAEYVCEWVSECGEMKNYTCEIRNKEEGEAIECVGGGRPKEEENRKWEKSQTAAGKWKWSLTHSLTQYPHPEWTNVWWLKRIFASFSLHTLTYSLTHMPLATHVYSPNEWPLLIFGAHSGVGVCVWGGGRWEQKQENYIRDMQMTLTSKRDYAAHRGYCTRTQTKQHTADHRRNEKSVGEIKMNSAMFRVIKIWGWQLPRNESVSPFVLYAIYVHFHM